MVHSDLVYRQTRQPSPLKKEPWPTTGARDTLKISPAFAPQISTFTDASLLRRSPLPLPCPLGSPETTLATSSALCGCTRISSHLDPLLSRTHSVLAPPAMCLHTPGMGPSLACVECIQLGVGGAVIVQPQESRPIARTPQLLLAPDQALSSVTGVYHHTRL